MFIQNHFESIDQNPSFLTTPQLLVSDDEVEVRLQNLVSDERKRTSEILHLINLADQRRLYLHRGFGSLFDWLTKTFSYSESAAHRRIMASRLLNSVPDISRKIASGEVNLSTLAKTQSAIRFEEKLSGTRLTNAAKADVIEKIENKTLRETDKALIKHFPKLVTRLEYERRTEVTETVTKLTLNLSGDTLESLDRVKELLAHKYPDATFAQVIGFLAKDFLKRKDPLVAKKESVMVTPNCSKEKAESREVAKASELVQNNLPKCDTGTEKPSVGSAITAEVRRKVFQRDKGCCTFKDHKSGTICGSTFQVEIDHILPRAMGGKNEPSNLRCLCRKHNQLMAEKNLGFKKANAWRNKSPTPLGLDSTS